MYRRQLADEFFRETHQGPSLARQQFLNQPAQDMNNDMFQLDRLGQELENINIPMHAHPRSHHPQSQNLAHNQTGMMRQDWALEFNNNKESYSQPSSTMMIEHHFEAAFENAALNHQKTAAGGGTHSCNKTLASFY
jgi:hypothetical protein